MRERVGLGLGQVAANTLDQVRVAAANTLDQVRVLGLSRGQGSGFRAWGLGFRASKG